MRFDLLNQSIELNAGEPPSLYNTLNMIRSLFQDVEDAADECLSQCPIGDEKLPLEIIWLSGELLSIYEDNSDALQRNRTRLDSIMKELRTLQAELEKIADTIALIPEKEEEHRKLLRQLETARAAQSAHAELLRKTEAAQNELAELKNYDTDAARQHLATLQEQIRQQKEEIMMLDSGINNLKIETTALQQELDQKLRPEHDRLAKLKQELEKQKQELLDQIAALTRETGELDTELVRLRRELPQRIEERDAAKQRVEEYRRTEYDPVAAERDKLLEAEKQLHTDKSTVEQQITTLTQSKRELTQQIRRMNDQIEQDTRDVAQKQVLEQELALKQADLTQKLEAATEALEIQQAEYNRLATETLPVAEERLAAETKRREDLQETVDALKRGHEDVTKDIRLLNDQLPGLQEKLENLKNIYSALVARFTASNADITELEQRISELKEKNDQERLARYRSQLAEQNRKLEDLVTSCTELETEIQQLTGQLEAENQRRENLKNRKQTLDDGLKGIAILLSELRPYDNEEYRLRAQKTQMRLHTLQTVRDNLAESISLAAQHFGGHSLSTSEMTVRDISICLTRASDYTRKMYDDLCECSKTLKFYIKEEPK